MPSQLSPDEPLDGEAWHDVKEENGREANPTWVHDEFAPIPFPDKRLEARFMPVAEQLAANRKPDQ